MMLGTTDSVGVKTLGQFASSDRGRRQARLADQRQVRVLAQAILYCANPLTSAVCQMSIDRK